MASLPPYLKVLSTKRSPAGYELEIAVRRWHPSWWAACWREARAYVAACVEMEVCGRTVPPLWHPAVLWHTLRATLAAIVEGS